MELNLNPLVEDLARGAGNEWKQVACCLVPNAEFAWARFAVWMLSGVKRSACEACRQAIEDVKHLWQRVLANDEPTVLEWNTARVNAEQIAWDANSKIFPWRSARLDPLANRDHKADRDSVFAAAKAASAGCGDLRLAGRSARNSARDARDAAIALVGESLQHALREAALQEQSQRLLLYLQLEQPPRDSTEAGLQQAVVNDEIRLPIYCDYREEHGDTVVKWLRVICEELSDAK